VHLHFQDVTLAIIEFYFEVLPRLFNVAKFRSGPTASVTPRLLLKVVNLKPIIKSCRVFPLWEKSDPDRRQVRPRDYIDLIETVAPREEPPGVG
jgi:hypothetical protein